MTIYLLSFYYGEYSDFCEINLGIFSSMQKAIEASETAIKDNDTVRNHWHQTDCKCQYGDCGRFNISKFTLDEVSLDKWGTQ